MLETWMTHCFGGSEDKTWIVFRVFKGLFVCEQFLPNNSSLSYLAPRLHLLHGIHNFRASTDIYSASPRRASLDSGFLWLPLLNSSASQLSAGFFRILVLLSPQPPPYWLNKIGILHITDFCKASVVYGICYKTWWKIKALIALWTLVYLQVEGTSRSIVFMNKNEQLLGTNWNYHIPVHNHSLSSQWSTCDHDLSLP